MRELFHVEHFLKTQFPKSDYKDFLKNIAMYSEEYFYWNNKINISAIKTKELFWKKHILDSLVLAKIIKKDFCNRELDFLNTVDLGSGAGLPGIVLGLILNKKTILIDKALKKVNFIKQTLKKLPNKNNTSFSAKQLNFLESDILEQLALKRKDTIVVSRAVAIKDLVKLLLKQRDIPVYLMTTNRVLLDNMKNIPKQIKIKIFSYAHFSKDDDIIKESFLHFSDYIILKMFHVKHS